MATLASLVDRVRLELGDPGKSFVWTLTATGTNRYEMPYSPVDAATLQVFVEGVDNTDFVECEEHTGVITFDTAPTTGDVITAQGTYYRYFTTAELENLTQAAVSEHVYNRTDAFGRQLTSANLPVVEDYPVALLATIKALYTLATDSSFDIDIQTPDGVSIPRSQRFRQLMDMIQSRREQYDQLCQALNIGLTRIETFTFRRISRSTNRYVPVYMPQEVDDRTPPMRVFLPIPTYGGSPVPQDAQIADLVFTQGDTYSLPMDFPYDISGMSPKAQIRLYPESATVVAEFAITIDPLDNTKVTLSLTEAQTLRVPLKSFWDFQLTDPVAGVHTYITGTVFCKRQITRV